MSRSDARSVRKHVSTRDELSGQKDRAVYLFSGSRWLAKREIIQCG